MKRFDGAVALIIGGTSGIGEATAQRLIDEGAQVVIAGRDDERGSAACVRLGDASQFLRVDATARAEVDGAVAEIERRHGRLDVLINSAGTIAVRPLATMRPDHWERTIAVNLSATFHACQAALPLLRQTAAGRSDVHAGMPAIVNVASLDGVLGDRGMTAYSAAKAGVINFSRSLALEVIEHGVRVNCVSPGAIDTPMTVETAGHPGRAEAFQAAIPIGRFGRADEIAAAIAFVASADASFMVGANLVVDGGVTSSTGHPDVLAMFDMDT